MYEHRLDVTISVRAPLLTQSTAAGRPGFDAVAARRDGKVVLPGSLVKGKLREAFYRLVALAGDAAPAPRSTVDAWLGQASPEGDDEAFPPDFPRGDNAPRRGRLSFSDFVTEAREDGGAPRYRVAIDRERGGVERGALAMVEIPFAPGRVVPFRGALRFVAGDEEADRLRAAVEAGLRFVDSVGAYRSLGFGRVVEVTVEPHVREVTSSPVDTATEAPSFGLEIEVDEPLLLARFQPQGNLFLGEASIPGGALKGALAATWREACGKPPSGPVDADLDPERHELGEHFSRIRFTHAFLGFGSRRPSAVPLSLVSARTEDSDELWDVALADGPCLISGRAPAFAIDWKSSTHALARSRCGWVSPRYETRVRTAIDARQQKGADGELFAYRTVIPRPGQAFYARVDLTGVPAADRARVAAQLRPLLANGLRHLGKTKARARLRTEQLEDAVERAGPGTVPSGRSRGGDTIRGDTVRGDTVRGDTVRGDTVRGDPLVLTLETPAVLLDPSRLREESGDGDLHAEYRRVFGELSGSKLSLLRFFARQGLAGGGYLWARFQSGRPYHPFLLTEPGSVFVFERGDAAEEVAAEWAWRGLELPGWAVERYAGMDSDGVERPGDDWRRCPFTRENGYGEVAVDLELHWELRPLSPSGEAVPDL